MQSKNISHVLPCEAASINGCFRPWWWPQGKAAGVLKRHTCFGFAGWSDIMSLDRWNAWTRRGWSPRFQPARGGTKAQTRSIGRRCRCFHLMLSWWQRQHRFWRHHARSVVRQLVSSAESSGAGAGAGAGAGVKDVALRVCPRGRFSRVLK